MPHGNVLNDGVSSFREAQRSRGQLTQHQLQEEAGRAQEVPQGQVQGDEEYFDRLRTDHRGHSSQESPVHR